MSISRTWPEVIAAQRRRYTVAGTPQALADLRCGAVSAVAEHLADLAPGQVTDAELLETLAALRLDHYTWHLHRLALLDALPAAALPTIRPPRPLTVRPREVTP